MQQKTVPIKKNVSFICSVFSILQNKWFLWIYIYIAHMLRQLPSPWILDFKMFVSTSHFDMKTRGLGCKIWTLSFKNWLKIIQHSHIQKKLFWDNEDVHILSQKFFQVKQNVPYFLSNPLHQLPVLNPICQQTWSRKPNSGKRLRGLLHGWNMSKIFIHFQHVFAVEPFCKCTRRSKFNWVYNISLLVFIPAFKILLRQTLSPRVSSHYLNVFLNPEVKLWIILHFF